MSEFRAARVLVLGSQISREELLEMEFLRRHLVREMALLWILVAAVSMTGIVQAQSPGRWLPCNEHLVPGQEECWMREIDFQFDGKAYRRLDIGVNGSVPGYAVKEGTRAKYFTDRPEFVFHQLGQKGWLKGTAHYYASGGVDRLTHIRG